MGLYYIIDFGYGSSQVSSETAANIRLIHHFLRIFVFHVLKVPDIVVRAFGTQ